MKIFPLLFCFVLLFAVAAAAQSNQDSSCPTIDVTGGGVAEVGEPTAFKLKVEGFDLSKLSFVWTISGGEILEGQGTLSIKVSRKNYDENLTATIEVVGLPAGCPAVESETASTIDRAPPLLFDEFGALLNKDVETRIKNLFAELGNLPRAKGYIINYGTESEIERHEKQIREAAGVLDLDASRMTLVEVALSRTANAACSRESGSFGTAHAFLKSIAKFAEIQRPQIINLTEQKKV